MTDHHRVLDRFVLSQFGFAEWLQSWTARARNGEPIRVFVDQDHTYATVITTGDGMTTTTTPQSALEAARARVAAEQEKLAKMERRIALAEAYKAGDVTIEAVAEELNVTLESARAALVTLGAITPRRRTITFEETQQALELLRAGTPPREVADGMGIVETIIRKLARENNLVRMSTKRSPETMEALEKLEAQVKGVYGAGFAALGEALRKYRAEKGTSAPVAEGAGEIDLASEPLPPPVAPPVAVNEPVVLSPEEEAAMAAPDSQPESPDPADWA